MFRMLVTLLLFGVVPLGAADLKIATLHPLLADLARSIGGGHVEVVDLIGPNGDPHHFEPKPDDLKRAEGAHLYLVAGMGLEGYLPKLKAIIADRATLVEVGATLPALEGACDHDEESTGHDHAHGVDPHWWHSIDLFRRATGVVESAMATASPENAAEFMRNAEAYRSQLDELGRWARREVSRIPRSARQLATAHAAFAYLCKDFGFSPFPVQGINREQMPDPRQLADLVKQLKDNHVAAIFPEKESNPKILQTLTHDTGIRLASPLIADGTGVASYQEMVRHNINTIVAALQKP